MDAKLARLARSTPNFMKPLLRPLYIRYLQLLKINRDELHTYWKNPWDGANRPEIYLDGVARSEFLGQLVGKNVGPDAKILEIGCNIGRNLNYLFEAGFKNLHAIEISETAVQLLRETYPEMANCIEICNVPVEDVIKHLGENEYDLVFTMAVLEHIHTDSEWIFVEMVRICKERLITIEDERSVSWRHFPRNYKRVFEELGMQQMEEVNCSEVEGLGSVFVARVFRKAV